MILALVLSLIGAGWGIGMLLEPERDRVPAPYQNEPGLGEPRDELDNPVDLPVPKEPTMRRLPYKTVPCEHCRPEDISCDWCDGTHREIQRVNEDKERVREALDTFFRAGRALGKAVGLR